MERNEGDGTLGGNVVVAMPSHFALHVVAAAQRLAPRLRMITREPDEPESRLVEDLRTADALIWSGVSLTGDLIRSAPRLRLIQKWGAGLDGVDVRAADEQGIIVGNVPGGNAVAVAEHFFALLLALAKRIPSSTWDMREGGWHQKELLQKGVWELRGKTLGLLGMGSVGREIVLRARAFGMRVVYCRRSLTAPPMPGAERVRDAAAVARQADVLGVVVALTPETKSMVSRDIFAALKPTAVIINVSRGAVVDETALLEALRQQRIAGAGLDVFSVEPVPPTSPLPGFDSVVTTPHAGGRTIEAMRYISERCIEEVLDALASPRSDEPCGSMVE